MSNLLKGWIRLSKPIQQERGKIGCMLRISTGSTWQHTDFMSEEYNLFHI